jgi:hypothetical protein
MIYADDLLNAYKKDKQLRYTGSKEINVMYYSGDESGSDSDYYTNNNSSKKQLKTLKKHKYRNKK